MNGPKTTEQLLKSGGVGVGLLGTVQVINIFRPVVVISGCWSAIIHNSTCTASQPHNGIVFAGLRLLLFLKYMGFFLTGSGGSEQHHTAAYHHQQIYQHLLYAVELGLAQLNPSALQPKDLSWCIVVNVWLGPEVYSDWVLFLSVDRGKLN